MCIRIVCIFITKQKNIVSYDEKQRKTRNFADFGFSEPLDDRERDARKRNWATFVLDDTDLVSKFILWTSKFHSREFGVVFLCFSGWIFVEVVLFAFVCSTCRKNTSRSVSFCVFFVWSYYVVDIMGLKNVKIVKKKLDSNSLFFVCIWFAFDLKARAMLLFSSSSSYSSSSLMRSLLLFWKILQRNYWNKKVKIIVEIML